VYTKSSLLIGAIFATVAFSYVRHWLKDVDYDIIGRLASLKGKRYKDIKDYNEGVIYQRMIGWMPAVIVEVWTVIFLSVFVVGFIFSVLTNGVDWDTW